MSKTKTRKSSKSLDPMENLPSKPRLCALSKGTGGYGFNLHGEKGKHGQFIRAVDKGSPADLAGLKPGDRVIEVSGTNIERETHTQVVGRIRADGGSTVLLVADRELDAYSKDHNITIKESMIHDKEPTTDDPPAQVVNGINGIAAVVDVEQKKDEPTQEDRIEPVEEQREESAPAIPEPEPEPTPEEAKEPEEIVKPDENDNEDAEIVAATQEVVEEAPVREPSPEPVRELTPEPVREPTPEPVREPTPEPEREPTPEPPREPTPPPREPTPPPREPTPPPREPTPPPREPTPPPREPTPPPPQTEEVDAPVPLQETKAPAPVRPPPPTTNNDSLDLSDMAKARALATGKKKKRQAAKQDWRSKYQAFNQL